MVGFGDVKEAERAAGAKALSHIIEICSGEWENSFIPNLKNKDNCSGLYKAVATRLGVACDATAQADKLIEDIRESPKWKFLKDGLAAYRRACAGSFVIGALKSEEHSNSQTTHGHIVIICDGDLYHKVYPPCWCGSISTAYQSRGDKSVGQVWNSVDRECVAYYVYGGYGFAIRVPNKIFVRRSAKR